MQKILVYGNRNTDKTNWNITSTSQRAEGFLKLFAVLNNFGVYTACPPEGREKKLFDLALTGNATAAEQLLKLRQNAEYEEWEIEEVN